MEILICRGFFGEHLRICGEILKNFADIDCWIVKEVYSMSHIRQDRLFLGSLQRGKLFTGSKVPFMLCFDIRTGEGRGGEKGNANVITKHREPSTQEIL